MARRIGVEVTTGTRSGPTNPGPPAGTFQIAGLTERGAVDAPVNVRSFTEYERRLGARTPYSGALYDAARLFFHEGGSDLLVTRVVGPNATAASVILRSPGEGEGDDVVRVSAVELGGYANGYEVSVERENDAHTVQVKDHDGNLLFSARNVTSAAQLAAQAETNRHVTLTTLDDQGGALNLNAGDFTLDNGSDDRESVEAADLIAALDAAGRQGEGGAVALPGYPADVVGEGLLDHASRTRKVALLSSYADAERVELETLAAQLQATGAGEYGALFHGHVTISDGSASRTVSPEAFVAALRARVFSTGRFWQVPAGTERGRARWATGAVPVLSRGDVEELDEVFVNGIETSGSRVFLNNWTSLSEDRDTLEFLRDADVLNNLAVRIERALAGFVWDDIDSRGLLHSDVHATVTAILAEVAEQGGAFAKLDEEGEELDPGYAVSVNPDPQLAAENRVEVDAGIRLPGATKIISVGLIKVAIGGDL